MAKKLHDIIESGKFCFIHKSEESNAYVQKVSLRLHYQSSSVPLSVHSSDRDTSPVLTSQSWNSEQIKDFVRKLGFLDKDKEQGSFFKQFLKLSQVSIECSIYNHCHILINPKFSTSCPFQHAITVCLSYYYNFILVFKKESSCV